MKKIEINKRYNSKELRAQILSSFPNIKIGIDRKRTITTEADKVEYIPDTLYLKSEHSIEDIQAVIDAHDPEFDDDEIAEQIRLEQEERQLNTGALKRIREELKELRREYKEEVQSLKAEIVLLKSKRGLNAS